jgi:hypothetical protein
MVSITKYNSMMVLRLTVKPEEALVTVQSERQSTGAIVLGAVVTGVLTLLFFSFFWNRFVGLRSGSGAFFTGSAMLSGIYPYRDYFTGATPLATLKSWAILAMFGDTLATLRGFDVLERTGLGLLVYFWLVRLFPAGTAAVAAAVTIIASACDRADPVSSYNHDAVFWAVSSGFAATFVLGRKLPGGAFAAAGLISGFLAAISLDTKQTVGLGVTVAVPFVVSLCLVRLESGRRAWQFLALFGAGWCAGAGALVLWLGSMHILPDFLEQVFVTGPAAKAGKPLDFVIRTVKITRMCWWAAGPGMVAMGLTIRSIAKANNRRLPGPLSSEQRELGLVLAGGTVALLAGAAAAYAGVHRISFSRPAIYYSFYTTIALLGYLLWVHVRRGLGRREAQCCLLAAVSFACAFMLSLSWPAFDAMTVPALAFPVAALLQELSNWRRPLVYGVCALLVCGATLQKLNDPFDFDNFFDPPARVATAKSALPELRGMRLPPTTVSLLDNGVRIIREHSAPEDTIYTYPEVGIFYALAHRRFPTVSGSHNIDVINDEFARSEARRLLAAPPAVIIYSRTGEDELIQAENFWRNGRRSGQRDMIAAIEKLIANYTLQGTFDVPPNRMPVKIYTRN